MGLNMISIGRYLSRMLFFPIGMPERADPSQAIFERSDGPEYYFNWNMPESDAVPNIMSIGIYPSRMLFHPIDILESVQSMPCNF